MLNMEPVGSGIGIISQELVLECQLDLFMYPDMQFRLYVEASYNNIVKNDMTDRAHDCIRTNK